MVAFLEHLLRHVDGRIAVVCDRAGIHRAKVVRAFLAANPRLRLLHTPAYAPECNPIERSWARVKRGLHNL